MVTPVTCIVTLVNVGPVRDFPAHAFTVAVPVRCLLGSKVRRLAGRLAHVPGETDAPFAAGR